MTVIIDYAFKNEGFLAISTYKGTLLFLNFSQHLLATKVTTEESFLYIFLHRQRFSCREISNSLFTFTQIASCTIPSLTHAHNKENNNNNISK